MVYITINIIINKHLLTFCPYIIYVYIFIENKTLLDMSLPCRQLNVIVNIIIKINFNIIMKKSDNNNFA